MLAANMQVMRGVAGLSVNVAGTVFSRSPTSPASRCTISPRTSAPASANNLRAGALEAFMPDLGQNGQRGGVDRFDMIGG